MNDTPDSKQKRLASLNQDVLAVSPSRSDDREQHRTRLREGRERLDSSPTQARQQQAGGGRGVLIALGGLSVVMLVLLGLVSLTLLNMQQRVDRLQAEVALRANPADSSADIEKLNQRLALLEKQLPKLQERLVVLEDQPVPVASADNRIDGSAAAAAGLAQVNARVRKLDIEVSRLSDELSSARQTLVAANERAERAEALANGQRATLAELIPRVDTLQASAGADSQLRDLEGRLDRVSNDIRSLYRMLEMGR